MNRKSIFILLIIILIFQTACTINRLEIKDRVVSPENNTTPIEGKWSIIQYFEKENEIELDSFLDLNYKEALFHKDAIVVAGKYIIEPSFKLRKVNLEDYLLYKYKVNLEDFNIENTIAEIITVLSDKQYFYEFIRFEDDKMLVHHNDKFYLLVRDIDKISKEEIERYINIENSISKLSKFKDPENISTGILLGIKTYDKEKIENWTYKTYWIRSNDRNIVSIYEVEDLFVPRKKGFWHIGVKREDKFGIEDKILTYNKILSRDSELSSMNNRDFSPKILRKSVMKHILYIGNDYVSTEIIDENKNQRLLRVYPIDYLDSEMAISVNDILDREEEEILNNSIEDIELSKSIESVDRQNFGLVRRNGYWIMKGRVNYESEGNNLYEDYNIKVMPPKELVNYDKLSISWSEIKSKVPSAIDAFTSPNEDIAIIETRNSIFVYKIEDLELGQFEIAEIRKTHQDSIVMAEWATGIYSNFWEEEVIKIGGKDIKK